MGVIEENDLNENKSELELRIEYLDDFVNEFQEFYDYMESILSSLND